jgi:F-type H+-transporting ATPase subunit b
MLTINLNLVFTIVNLIILYLLLKHFLFKPVMEIMNKRQAMIEQSISNARNSEGQASELKKQYEDKLAASNEEGTKLIEEARVQAKAQYDRIVKGAQSDAGRVIEDAHKKAEADQKKAMQEAKTQIAGLVIAATAKVVNQEAAKNNNQSLYDAYLAEAGDSHDSGSN